MLTKEGLLDDWQRTLERAGGLAWEPFPWQVDPFVDPSPIILFTGSAGGGKSHLAAHKLHAFLSNSERPATGLMLRKAREFASKSIVPFMRHTVHKDSQRVAFKKADSRFIYDNGSVLHWGGMKDDMQREALRSIGQAGSVDIVWMEEANAFTWLDFQEILGRMRGTAGDYRQVILTTNPDAPTHWINEKLILGGLAKVYYSGAVDNPALPDDYRKTLDMLTGVMHDRLVKGLWVMAEGVIYDNFSPEHNVTDAAEYDPEREVLWGVDDGYAAGDGPGSANYHPRVILLGQLTAQGGIDIFNEYYATQELSEVTIKNVLDWPYKEPINAYIDSAAAELRGRIWERGLYSIPATHKVQEGIKNLRRLICDGQDVRLLRIHPRCKNLIRELQSYRYDDNSKVATVGEQKAKKVDDHGPDCLRYLTWHLRTG